MQQADRPAAGMQPQLVDLTDDLLRLVLRPQHIGAASTCHRFRTIILASIQERCIKFPTSEEVRYTPECRPYCQPLCTCAEPASAPCLPFALEPLSRLTQLTKLEIGDSLDHP
jgi:hypothetical protein